MAATTSANSSGPTTRRMASQSSQSYQHPLHTEEIDSTPIVSSTDCVTNILCGTENAENILGSTPSNHAQTVNISSLPVHTPSLPNLSNLSSIYDCHRKLMPVYKSCREIDNHFHETFDYIDRLVSDKVNEKMTQLDEGITPRLIIAGKAIDEKIEKCESSFLSTIDKAVTEKVVLLAEKHLATKEFDPDTIMRIVTNQLKMAGSYDNELRADFRIAVNENNLACEKLPKEIKSSINFLSDGNVSQTGGAVPISEQEN